MASRSSGEAEHGPLKGDCRAGTNRTCVKGERLEGPLSGTKVTIVNRIERTAKKAHPHSPHASSREAWSIEAR